MHNKMSRNVILLKKSLELFHFIGGRARVTHDARYGEDAREEGQNEVVRKVGRDQRTDRQGEDGGQRCGGQGHFESTQAFQ